MLNLVIQDSSQPLQDVLAFQHLSWAILSHQREHLLRAVRCQLTTIPLARIPYIIRAQIEWLDGAWGGNRMSQVRIYLPPPIFVFDWLRRATVHWICQLPQEMQSPCGEYHSMSYRQRSSRHSDPSGVTLSQMAEYASTTDAQLKLTLSNLRIRTPRKTSLVGFLMQAIITVSDFPTTKIIWLTTDSFSPHSETNSETSVPHCKPSRIAQILAPPGPWGTSSI